VTSHAVVGRVVRGSAVIALALAVPAGAVRAGGFEVPDQSAVAAATGGASTARRGDPSAAFYNPAALADRAGLRAAVGVLLAIPRVSVQGLSPDTEIVSTTDTVSPPPHLHLAYAEDAWAIGGYVGVSHGTSVAWPEGWWGRHEAIGSSLLVIRAAPFFALRLGGDGGCIAGFPDVRISIGAHVDTARAETRRGLDFIDTEGSVHVLAWGAGVGGDASIYWQATAALALGLTYKSRTWMRASGDADFEVPDAFLGRAPDQRASTEIVIPDRLVLGAAWQQRDFAVLADVGFSAWSVRDRQRVDFESESTADSDVALGWRDTWAVRVGGEISPVPWLHARAGIFYDMEAAPAETLAPSAPDLARLGITLGAGFEITPEIGVDASYSYVALLGRESTSEDAPLARYQGELHSIALTARFALAPSAAARRDPAPADRAIGDHVPVEERP
jgi:long-chain fatty acid transport protein